MPIRIKNGEKELKFVEVNFLAPKEKIDGILSKFRINTLWKHSLIGVFFFLTLYFINNLLCEENGNINMVQKAYLKGKWVKLVWNSNYENNHKQVTQ